MRSFRQASGRLAAHTRSRQFRGLHGSAVRIQQIKNPARGGGSLHLLCSAALPQPTTKAADCSSVQHARSSPLREFCSPLFPRRGHVVRSILLTNLFRQGPSSAAGGGSSGMGHLDSFRSVYLQYRKAKLLAHLRPRPPKAPACAACCAARTRQCIVGRLCCPALPTPLAHAVEHVGLAAKSNWSLLTYSFHSVRAEEWLTFFSNTILVVQVIRGVSESQPKQESPF